MSQRDATVNKLIAAYESLRPEEIDTLLQCYACDAIFQDPFNRVRGHAQIASVFEHMFETLAAPRFVVTCRTESAEAVVLGWDFFFESTSLGGAQKITGLSRLSFNGEDLVSEHLDFWDPSAGIYEKLPVIGWLLRRLRRAMTVRQPR